MAQKKRHGAEEMMAAEEIHSNSDIGGGIGGGGE